MGTDDLHKKRRNPKTGRQLARNSPKQPPATKILIVSEGSNTEPQYFKDAKKVYRLHAVVVDDRAGSAPVSVYRRAKDLSEYAKNKGDAYDTVFCVIDKDEHAGYQDALERMRMSGFKAITSVPCFEYWLLLHFTFTTKPIARTQKKSPGDVAEKQLKEKMPHYRKGMSGVFSELEDRLPTAINNAQRAHDAAKSGRTDNPSTRVHELVCYLQELRN
ncbi:RloB family protein [Desulfurispira natronophila]|uniref:RloB domain-containing protein n=1 Tax=Desulfurispira natronophila TaxID=682562 RepID=A0A7W7Y5P6_9BACT|nr:RloB family protein [Desulfurispira natronophila]MBB5022534.1 hypothetical protein [Desulfurispira natronophila]